jgi:hypothetical protein
MRYLVIFVSILLAATHAASQKNTPGRQKLAADPSAKVNTETPSVSAAANNAFGQCRCDITVNSCDTFCCCDKDCDDDVKAFWTENYNEYCAKN